MAPGYRFTLHDTDGLVSDAKLLAVRVETFATELTPQGTLLDQEPFGFTDATGALVSGYESRFLALSEAVPYRPSRRTPKPKIHGVQAAVVTAEELASADRPAIHADSTARVRVRFPWDQHSDTDDATPTSRWIRVSQYWAGAGYGALYMPRVGHEVLVAYMQGDPDQPVIVGRVYNVQHPPPYDPSKEPTKSTLKSQSAKEKEEVDGFNELRFEDKAKQEEIYLHAQRNLNEVVLANHSTSVGGDQSNTVFHNQSNTVHGHRTHRVDGYETISIGDYETIEIGTYQTNTIGTDRTTRVGADERLTVGGLRDTTIVGNETLVVGGQRVSAIAHKDELVIGGERITSVHTTDKLSVGAARTVTTGGDYDVMVTGTYNSQASSNHVFKSTNTYNFPSGDFQVSSTSAYFFESSSFFVNAAGAILSMRAGLVTLTNGAGATITLAGGLVTIDCASLVVTTTGTAQISAGTAMVLKSGADMGLTSSGDINAKGGTIKLNG
jgi:type VI secretion system secreted protein VgrG